jgi:hypothetical protein
MSNENNRESVTLTVRWTDFASKNLDARIAELKRRDQPIKMEPVVEGIQFLRGVGSRASLVLPMFYTLAGATTKVRDPAEQPPWKPTQAASFEFSALQTISLICRAVFDDSRKGLTGKRLANASDETLDGIAQHWSQKSKRPIEEASNALKLLRDLFQQCAQPRKTLLVSESLLERRVGLLKYHADRQAAHISLEPFLFGLIDIVHVVAAITIVGSIIVDFDQPQLSASYFDEIDKASWSAAKATFPDMAIERLFLRFDIHQQAKNYWKFPGHQGLRMLLSQLPSAIGYWDSQDEAVEAQTGY